MNKDSQNIFENYVNRLVEAENNPAQDPTIAANQGVNTAPPAAPAAQPQQQAAQAGVTQTDILAGIIANGDEEFLKQLFAIPQVAQLMQSKMQPAQPAQQQAPAQPAAAPAPAPNAAPAQQNQPATS